MNNNFLHDLQEDILDRKGIYVLYIFIFIISFIITIKNIQVYFDIVRLILSGTALVFLSLIYLICKDSRNKNENRVIIQDMLFAVILTLACIYELLF